MFMVRLSAVGIWELSTKQTKHRGGTSQGGKRRAHLALGMDRGRCVYTWPLVYNYNNLNYQKLILYSTRGTLYCTKGIQYFDFDTASIPLIQRYSSIEQYLSYQRMRCITFRGLRTVVTWVLNLPDLLKSCKLLKHGDQFVCKWMERFSVDNEIKGCKTSG